MELGSRAVLKKEGVTVPTARQLNCKIRAAEKFLAILFLLMADCQIYGKVI